MKRREFLQQTGILGTAFMFGCQNDKTINDTASVNSDTDSGNDIENTLFIPPLAESVVDTDGFTAFNLYIKESEHKFFDGQYTRTFAIDGTYLGPTIRVSNQEKVRITYHNQLTESTTMHGHGMHVPAKMDGGPHQKILSATSWTTEYTVTQQASTNWYHPHEMGTTAEQVYMGLAGFIWVDDQLSQSLDLPNQYGVNDIPLVLQDRFFDENNQLDYSPTRQEIMHGYIGDTFIANGQIEPTFLAVDDKIRFRILNGSNSSMYRLQFTNDISFYQIASDGGLLESPVQMTQITLSPGERAEIVIDLSEYADTTLSLIDSNHGGTFLHIQTADTLTQSPSLPTTLTTLERWKPEDVITTRQFRLGGGQGNLYINEQQMDMMRIDETVPLNEVEIWEIVNEMGMDHNFHIHATHFLLLDRNGDPSAIAENERGYKDVVHIPPFESVRIILKMVDYSDPDGKYMFHCHFLEHEDAGMMGQFVVVDQ